MKLQLICIALLLASPAAADITAKFSEGAPKDRFTLTNTGECVLPAMTVKLDLGTSPAGLIFDVTASGAGVEVFQPFELVSGAENLTELPAVVDGDSAIVLPLSGLGPNQSVSFTIDVDDTGGGREITVNGSEIAGATVIASFGANSVSGVFSDRATAIVHTAACTS